MIVACWSGPRNISTALMRSWSSRKDTFVTDEPFYAYYLKETQKKHPMREEIINNYFSNYDEIINYLTDLRFIKELNQPKTNIIKIKLLR